MNQRVCWYGIWHTTEPSLRACACVRWPQGETYTFKAQKPELAENWVLQLQSCIEDIQAEKMRMTSGSLSQKEQPPDEKKQGDEHPSVIAMPETTGKRLLYGFTLPMLVCFYISIPDVRQEQWFKGNWYLLTMMNAVIWLAVLAYGMMVSAETCGCLMEIEPDLMGLTATAVGTSLPNLFASVLVARQGLGNMAVSNAFGSNTFNIFIALGVPWMIGCLRSEDGVYKVDKGHIFGTCLILVGVLTLFLFGLGMTKMKLTPKVGWVYIATYFVFISYLILSEPRLGYLPEMPF